MGVVLLNYSVQFDSHIIVRDNINVPYTIHDRPFLYLHSGDGSVLDVRSTLSNLVQDFYHLVSNRVL